MAVLMLVLAGAPTLAVPDFGLVQIPQAEFGAFYAEHFVVKLGLHGVAATTQKDIEGVLGLERQRALLGCSDASVSCAVELAGALGVDGLVTGQIARVGSVYQINLRVISARSASTLYAFSRQVRDEEEILTALADAAAEAATKLGGTAPPAVVDTTAAARASTPFAWAPWAVVGVGVVSVAVGAVYAAQATAAWDRLGSTASTQLPPDEAFSLSRAGAASRTVAVTTLSLGVAAVGAGLAWRFLGSRPVVTLAPAQSGAAVVVGGTF